MGAYEELKSFQPTAEYYENFLEMQEILKAQGKVFDDIENSLDIVEANCFLDSITEYGIQRWANIVAISFRALESDEYRRNQIVTKLIGGNKLNKPRIIELSKFFTKEPADVVVKDEVIFIIYENTPDEDLSSFVKLLGLLKPVGLEIGFREVIIINLGFNPNLKIDIKSNNTIINLGISNNDEEPNMSLKEHAYYVPDGEWNPQQFDIFMFNGLLHWNGEYELSGLNPYGKLAYINNSFNVGFKKYRDGILEEEGEL